MVTAEAAMAVVRAACPFFRGAHDGLAFAANAAFLADGYSLCAVGRSALFDPLPAGEEVGIEGWNSMDNCYAFLYSKDEEEGKKKCIFMKCVVIADFLAIDAMDLEAQHEEPFHVQINVKDFFSEVQTRNYKDLYKNFTDFINILNLSLLAELNGKDAAAAQNPNAESSSSMNSYGNVMWGKPTTMTTEQTSSEYALWENPSTRTAGYECKLFYVLCYSLIYPPVVLFGHDDTFPAPGAGFYPHSGETGGTMHVGPNDPCFFPSTPSTPFGDPGYVQSVPPGGRYDPIGPPDVPGFEPSRFVRRSRHSGGSTHPDLEFSQQDPDFF
ncbi:probable proteasome inhibitor [Triticum dicoccoides]|uniref:probable proteasome inhibitor n=1 Tax=Triticum dicoccoides TaxID=85692 RepID=UPI0018915932|nr:probable proteasome inhibitor [Triticum dicoccoides]